MNVMYWRNRHWLITKKPTMRHVHFSFYFSFFLFLFPFQLIVQRYRSEKALGMRDNPQTYFLFTCTIRRLGNSALVNYVKWFVDLACYKVSQLKVCALSRVKHIFVICRTKTAFTHLETWIAEFQWAQNGYIWISFFFVHNTEVTRKSFTCFAIGFSCKFV